ncbi:NnrU family protein [Aestuariibius sp. HNIBRBA575]|uniref:NnrU family protein n=1 Tax=Aestuariibius sp. HNIBRBA575 TaxID=3233343 RepID=UPI0034A0E7E3
MVLLILGVALWWAAHLFKRVAPERRAAMGEKGAAPVAIAIVLAIVLMVIGYRSWASPHIWFPQLWLTHVNNTLMILSVLLFGMASTSGRLRGKLRHPMLMGFGTWCLAHLLVNGDLASIILWGGLWAWAITEVKVINAKEPNWDRPEPGTAKGDVKLVVISLAVFGVITAIHGWIGPSPFPV